MRTRKCLVAVLIIATCITTHVRADTVLDIRQIELLEQGSFLNQEAWTVSGSYGYANDPLRYSTAWIENDSLRVTHDRTVNSRSVTVWAELNQSTGHVAATNAPDGTYTISNGPEIILSGFDTVSFEGKPILELKVFLAMQVPVRLADDEVRLLMDNGTGGSALLHTWFHTETPIDAFDSPYWNLQLDVNGMTAEDLDSIVFTVDYASKGGQDDSELRLDALGLQVTYQQIANGVEFVRVSTIAELPMLPWIDIEPQQGIWSGFIAETCGLSVDQNATSSVWTSPVIEPPPGQKIGRFWVQGDGNSSLSWRLAGSGETWIVTTEDPIDVSDTIELQLEASDGCFDGVRIDFNQPEVVVKGQMSGDLAGIDTSLSSLAIVIDGTTMIHTMFVEGEFEVRGPIAWGLSDQEMDVQIVVRFQWADGGAANSFSVLVDSVQFSGGFEFDIDKDPVCEEIADLSIEEDSAAREFDMSLRCSDDRDATLSYSIDSSQPSIVNAEISGTEVAIQPIPEAWGLATVTVTVSDGSGNTKVMEIEVAVLEVADPPSIGRSDLPSTVYVEVGAHREAQLSISDIDTPLAELTWTSTSQWVSVSQIGIVSILAGTEFDEIVYLNVTDGTHQSNISFRLNATFRPDLTISELVAIPSSAQDGEMISIRATITNLGEADARQFWLSCTVNDQPLGRAAMFGLLAAGNSTTHSLEWKAMGSGEKATLSCMIDELDHIRESDEDNNFVQISLDIKSSPPTSVSSDISSEQAPMTPAYGAYITGVIVILGGCYLVFGPDKIRKAR